MAVNDVLLRKKQGSLYSYKNPAYLQNNIKMQNVVKKSGEGPMKSTNKKKNKILHHGKLISQRKYQKFTTKKKSTLLNVLLINSVIIIGMIMILWMIAVLGGFI